MDRSRLLAERLLKAWKPVPGPDAVPRCASSARIPKRLHQIWLGGEPPAAMLRNAEALQASNPGWSHRLYRDADAVEFVEEHYPPEVLRCYERIDPRYPAARSDLLRYLVLYRLGGVYLDLKSGARHPLDEVLRTDDRYLLAHWPNGPGETYEGWGLWPELASQPRGEFVQWFIAAAAGHPFLRAAIRRVLDNVARYSRVVDGAGRPGVVRTTGPVAYTLAILPELARHEHRVVDAERDLGFVYTLVPDWRSGRETAAHYSTLREPVVVPRASDRAADLLGDGLVACRAAVRKTLARNPREPS